jgi:hypothetical protein
MNTRVASPLAVLAALSAIVALTPSCSRAKAGPSIVVRFAEPPARGQGELALASCLVTVQNAGGVVLAAQDVPASKEGGVVRKVRFSMSQDQIAAARRVIATCTDEAGRTGTQAVHSLSDKPAGQLYTHRERERDARDAALGSR